MCSAHPHGDLVLRTAQRKAYAFLARQQRALWEFSKNRRKFLCGELAITVAPLRHGLRCRKESDGTCTFRFVRRGSDWDRAVAPGLFSQLSR